MNLKEIQDNAPDGATHYYKVADKVIYYKEYLGLWAEFNNDDILVYTGNKKENDRLSESILPLYPTPKEKKEMKTYGEYKETSYNYDATWLDFSSKDGTIETALIDNQEPKDPTNPSHYKQGKVECIDAIESALVGKKGIEASLVGNIIKYLWRYEEKNGVEDVEKAKWYLDKLLEKLRC